MNVEELLHLNYWFSIHGQNINIKRHPGELQIISNPLRLGKQLILSDMIQ